MRSLRNSITIIIISIILAPTAFAQDETAAAAASTPASTAASTSAPAVLVSTTADNLRFTSPEQAAQMRLEVYAAGGQQVFDSGLHNGNILDWKLTEARLAVTDGSYLCLVTVKDLRGRATQRFGTISVQAGQVSVSRAREEELTPAQAQALAASRQSQKIVSAGSDTALTIVRENNARALTLTAHDGQDGQVTSTSGGLTFRTGDALTNQAKERVRITPEGQVGIGTDSPEATLDVAGTIRARKGIVFADGTVLTTAPKAESRLSTISTTTTPGQGLTTNTTGAGTPNRLTKWTDSIGSLGDSIISEIGGNVGIGTDTPKGNLQVAGAPQAVLYLSNMSANADEKHWYFDAELFGGSSYMFWGANNDATNSGTNFTRIRRTGAAINEWTVFPSLVLANDGYGGGSPNVRSASSVPLTVKGVASQTGDLTRWADSSGNVLSVVNAAGNFGIGTAAPTQRLEVAGNLKLSGANSGIVFSDGSVMTTAGGGNLSGTNVVNAINNAATVGTINDNRLSSNLARLNGANAWSGANVFGAGLSANNALITNVGLPVNAGDAVNKAYTDANFVRFVPGAEQLSVGDANGTAPMINLRGGSTCCSGPGGHTPAWFKVFQNGSFVATGNLGIGVSPMQGKGYRTSWDSYKGAFRSGYADNEWDDATVGFFSWAGGSNSTAEGLYAFAFGDTNFARSTSSIAFGSGNEVKGAAGFSAGAGNRVCDTYGVAFGNKAQSGGPLINGKCDPDTFNIRGLAAVAIGYNVTADQDHTTAMGKFASNNGFTGTFIWSDGSAQQSADTFRNTANNEFAARATGGFRFRTNLGGTTGCNLPAGSGVFNCTSSRATKENFLLVRGEDVLSKLRNLQVSTWNYIAEGRQVRHMGPMAEDFYKAFALGTGNTSIGVQDLAGVSLAAVKALEERTVQLQQKIAEVEQLRSQLSTLEQRFAALEKLVQAGGSALNTTAGN
ncbi:MAG TPA: tail fiber domain-containing protein [Pyrinomonadaceae bacterium]|jgi:hypothetical protein